MLLWLVLPPWRAVLAQAGNLMPGRALFGDLFAILQAGSCWRLGVNVYLPNACMDGGSYNYAPPLLPVLGWMGGTAATMPAAIILALALLAAAALLPAACSRAEIAFRAAALCSSAVQIAFASANIDAVMFILAICGILLLTGRFWTAGYALFLALAALKFYPAALFALVLREPARRVAAFMILLVLAGAAYLVAGFGHGTATALARVPQWLPFLSVFGARDLAFGLVLFHATPSLSPSGAQILTALSAPGAGVVILLGTKLLSLAAVLAGWFTAPRRAVWVEGLADAPARFLLAGAALIVLCFFAAQNVDYRGLFLLFLLPAFWGRSAACFVTRALLWEAALLHLARALGAPPAVQLLLFLAREAGWWWLVIQLIAILVCFARVQLRRWTVPHARECYFGPNC
jgi:hypothetical protein